MTSPRRFMIDLETLGTGVTSVPFQIGVVQFQLPHFNGELFEEGWIGEGRTININIDSALRAGMTVDGGTIEWWFRQSQEARDQWLDRPGEYPLHEALDVLAQFLLPVPHKQDKLEVWAHGDVFDIAILNHAYRLCRLETPWKYNAVRDARTTYGLTGVWPGATHDESLIPHKPQDDCIRQIRAVIEGVRVLEQMRYDNYLRAFAASGREQPDELVRAEILADLPFAEAPSPAFTYKRDTIITLASPSDIYAQTADAIRRRASEIDFDTHCGAGDHGFDVVAPQPASSTIVTPAASAPVVSDPLEGLKRGEDGLFWPPPSKSDEGWVPPENESDPLPNPEGWGEGRTPMQAYLEDHPASAVVDEAPTKTFGEIAAPMIAEEAAQFRKDLHGPVMPITIFTPDDEIPF